MYKETKILIKKKFILEERYKILNVNISIEYGVWSMESYKNGVSIWF